MMCLAMRGIVRIGESSASSLTVELRNDTADAVTSITSLPQQQNNLGSEAKPYPLH